MTSFEVHLIDKHTGVVERSLPAETWEEAWQITQRVNPDKYSTRITEQENQ